MNKEELEFKVNQIIYRKVLDENDCNKIIQFYNNRELNDSISVDYDYDYKLNNGNVDQSKKQKIRISREAIITNEEEFWIHSKLDSELQEINKKFFGFELTALKLGRYNLLEYGKGGKFDWHLDQGTKSLFSNRRISIVIFLSNPDEYEGGQLEFLPMLKNPLKMEKGYMVVFPSHKLHRVSPITSGIRRTMVNWIYENKQI